MRKLTEEEKYKLARIDESITSSKHQLLSHCNDLDEICGSRVGEIYGRILGRLEYFQNRYLGVKNDE